MPCPTPSAKNAPAHPLAVLRLRATLPDLPTVIPPACGTVWNTLKSHNIPAGRLVALYLDDLINLEVGVELSAPLPPLPNLHPSSTPPGPVLTTTHLGPYPLLPQAHQALRQFAAQHNLPLAGSSWETYAHWQPEWNNNPSQIRTDIYYLLKE